MRRLILGDKDISNSLKIDGKYVNVPFNIPFSASLLVVAGGGGGGGSFSSNDGGSGIVILRYLSATQQSLSGDTIFQDGGYWYHKFTTVGSTNFQLI